MSNPIRPTLKTEIIPTILLIVVAISSFFFYANFPERVPVHWNIAGEVDNWGSPLTAAFLFPLIIIVVYLLMLFVPYLDPKKQQYNKFRKVYHIIKLLLVLFCVAIYYLTSFNALGHNLPIGITVPILVGVLFIIVGAYMSKIKQNWFMGIRTPWTLSSQQVWDKSHRFGGKMFMLSGFLMIINGLAPVSWRIAIFIAAILIVIIGTVGGSYYFYYIEEKKKKSKRV